MGARPGKTIVIGAIPGVVRRGPRVRKDLTYVPYARASWGWWCRKRGVELVVLDQPVPGPLGAAAPPIQRWQAVGEMLAQVGSGQIAVVDADTMVHWDAPDFFDLATDALGAVHVGTRTWLKMSVEAYGAFFPGVKLDWRTCFNSGLVVLNATHAPMLAELVKFYSQHRQELEALQAARNVGVDQTLVNYFAALSGTPIRLLDPVFNRMRCFEFPAELRAQHESSGATSRPDELEQYLASAPGFEFIQEAYVWHFTKTVRTRAAVMRETWRRVQHHYPDHADPPG
jgi:hypothetical protein